MATKKYPIVQIDGSTKEMTIDEVSAETGVPRKTVERHIKRVGMRNIKNLGVDPEAARKKARRVFAIGSAAHFAENAEKREAVASRPVYRDFRPR